MYTNKHAWTNKDGTYKEVYYYICGRNKQERGHHCDYKASLRKIDIEPLVIEAVKELVSDKYFAKEIEKRIGVQTDTTAIDKELANYESKLKEVDLNKARLEREIDNLPIDARFRERKIHDMTLRLDALYDTIVELEERIEDAKLRKSSIEMETITLDNIYKLMLNFGKLYDIISDEEKKSLITYLIKEIQIYPNGESEQPLKSIEFNFPIYRDGQEVRRLLWEKGNTVDTYTVTYTDGVDGEIVFPDQVTSGLKAGTATPAFAGGTPTREGYVFAGWKPAVAGTVTGNATYVAQWKVDMNGSGVPDDEEMKYTVTYTDGAANGAAFAEQKHPDLLPGTPTPAWEGVTDKPYWEGHVFIRWEPTVAPTVTGDVTYVAQWKDDRDSNGVPDDEETKYTVTYTDGVEGEEVFKDQVYEGLLSGEATPKFDGREPARKGYVFAGWKPAVAEKVTGNATYVAQWKDDRNSNSVPDDEETKYTVTYTDGVEGEEVFKDQVYEGLLSGEATPKFDGREPARKGYIFAGWKPAVADTVTGNVTYVAQWKEDKNGNGTSNDEETKYTVTYTDGVENEEIFKDQVYEGLLSGEATPKFDGREPTRKGYIFAGWKLAVADTVTGNATYVAQWKKLDAAQTGDTMNLTIWYCLLGAAGICFVAAFVLAKKKQSDK